MCFIIFNLASEHIIRKFREFEGINLLGIKVQITTYADENSIIFEIPKNMNEILDVIYRVTASIGIKFNINKCKSLSFFSSQH